MKHARSAYPILVASALTVAGCVSSSGVTRQTIAQPPEAPLEMPTSQLALPKRPPRQPATTRLLGASELRLEAGQLPEAKAASTPLRTSADSAAFAAYDAELRRRVSATLISPERYQPPGLVGTIVVVLVVNKDGTLRWLYLRQSSGVEALDQYVLNAIRLAAPFPAPPGGRNGVTLTGTFRLPFPRLSTPVVSDADTPTEESEPP